MGEGMIDARNKITDFFYFNKKVLFVVAGIILLFGILTLSFVNIAKTRAVKRQDPMFTIYEDEEAPAAIEPETLAGSENLPQVAAATETVPAGTAAEIEEQAASEETVPVVAVPVEALEVAKSNTTVFSALKQFVSGDFNLSGAQRFFSSLDSAQGRKSIYVWSFVIGIVCIAFSCLMEIALAAVSLSYKRKAKGYAKKATALSRKKITTSEPAAPAAGANGVKEIAPMEVVEEVAAEEITHESEELSPEEKVTAEPAVKDFAGTESAAEEKAPTEPESPAEPKNEPEEKPKRSTIGKGLKAFEDDTDKTVKRLVPEEPTDEDIANALSELEDDGFSKEDEL